MSDDIKEVYVIYLGRFETSKHKVGARFIPVELFNGCSTEPEVIEKSSYRQLRMDCSLASA